VFVRCGYIDESLAPNDAPTYRERFYWVLMLSVAMSNDVISMSFSPMVPGRDGNCPSARTGTP
jgi:hypothetical protein